MNARPSARRAAVGESRAVGAVLGDAFADDPVMRWIARFDGDMSGRVRPLFTKLVEQRLALDDPLVWNVPAPPDTTGDAGLGAAAVRYGPGQSLPPVDALRLFPSTVGCFRWGMWRLLRQMASAEKAHPDEPHYYLFLVGSDPQLRGGGYGSEVLRPMLDRCDEEGVAAYLENSKPRNEAFYVHHGFAPRAPIELPGGAPPLVPMLRSPR